MTFQILNQSSVEDFLDSNNCDEYCCWNEYHNKTTLCFGDYNLTDQVELHEWKSWEEGIRWSATIGLAGFGIIGNFLLVFILLSNRLLLKASINVFILNMALADLTTAVTGPVPFTIREKPRYENWILGEAWCKLENPLQLLPMIVSVFTLATISIDRMLGVVKPLHRYLKARQAIFISIIIWIFSSVISAPFGFYMDFTTKRWNDITEHNCGEIDNHLKVMYAIVDILLAWVPLLIMLISYITIFINFQKLTKSARRREHPALLHVKKRVFLMMFIVVTICNVSWMPFMVFRILSFPGVFFINTNNNVEEKYTKLYKTYNSVAHYMMYMSPAINPYVYALLHRNYRRALRITVPCIFKNKSELMLTPRDGGRGYAWSRSRSHSKSQPPLPRNGHQSAQIHKDDSAGSSKVKRLFHNLTHRGKDLVELQLNGRSVRTSHLTTTKFETEMSDYKRPYWRKDNESYPEELSARKLLPAQNILNLFVMEVIEEEHSSDLDSSERQL